jgi:carbamoyl-phosphate synthase small subunit
LATESSAPGRAKRRSTSPGEAFWATSGIQQQESSLRSAKPPAVLALSDGTVFKGHAIGVAGHTTAEVVFNTAMTGYQEILTDPSYCRQIVTLTYPHIGNTGWNDEDDESKQIYAAGLIVKDVPSRVSNFRSQISLQAALKRESVVAIAGLDTRELTRHLRTHGAQNGCIMAAGEGATLSEQDVAAAIERARAASSMAGLDLAKVVSTEKRYRWAQTPWVLGQGYGTVQSTRFKVVAFDFGVKRNILRLLAARGCDVIVVPAQTPAVDVLAMAPDGVFLGNGPGDPEPCQYAIDATRSIVERGVPTFGICLGHQILALASGAKTFKMKFGHHGANHPVKDLDTGRVSITSQNHGFAVDETSMPNTLRATHVSLFDGTLQGIARTDKPAFGFQGHPEASPGPHDIEYLFDRFAALMSTEKKHAQAN